MDGHWTSREGRKTSVASSHGWRNEKQHKKTKSGDERTDQRHYMRLQSPPRPHHFLPSGQNGKRRKGKRKTGRKQTTTQSVDGGTEEGRESEPKKQPFSSSSNSARTRERKRTGERCPTEKEREKERKAFRSFLASVELNHGIQQKERKVGEWRKQSCLKEENETANEQRFRQGSTDRQTDRQATAPPSAWSSLPACRPASSLSKIKPDLSLFAHHPSRVHRFGRARSIPFLFSLVFLLLPTHTLSTSFIQTRPSYPMPIHRK
mmetsp:Transcript_40926/g.80688  ORF Transcript_40926/g.80688 Transcript_40926/m.80688 type:complete len:263 (+) Transcript_40926:1137-1925(+)